LQEALLKDLHKKGGKMNIRTMKTVAFVLLLLAGLNAASPAWAEEDRPSAELSVSLLSAYIWRGQELSKDSLVIQPSATFSFKGFSANIWANYDTDLYHDIQGLDNLTETDYTLSYQYDFGPVSAQAGYIYYALDRADDSQELFISATLDTLLSPTLTVYREFAHYPGTYLTLEVSHSLGLGNGLSLDMGLLGSALFSNDSGTYPDPDDESDDYSGLHHGKASLSMTVPFSSFIHDPAAQYFSLRPEVNWIFPLSGDGSKDMAARALGDTGHNNFVYGGATVSFSF